jgi:electron transport complex protein RnfG
MKSNLQMIAVLTLVGVASGGGLVFMARYAEPLIAQHQEESITAAVRQVLPSFDPAREATIRAESKNIYAEYDDKGNLVGYAFKAEGPGFQDKIFVMIGIAPDLEHLTGIKIMDPLKETPGLGEKIKTEGWFQEQFEGKDVSEPLKIKPQRPADVDAITGATISSRAVVRIINENIPFIKEAVEKGSGSEARE